MPDRNTCHLCGHEDWATELFAQAGPTGAHWYCRNNRLCSIRERDNREKAHNMEFATFTEPERNDSADYKAPQHYGNSAVVKVLEHKPSIVTPNSPNGAPGVICDLHDLNEKATYHGVLFMTGAIVDAFKPHVGGPPIVIKWDKRTANNGRNYAAPIAAPEGAIAAAKALYANGDPFLIINTVQGGNDAEAPY